MEPLSALSIAAAIAQFIDFTSGLLSNANDIFHSAKGMSTENAKIEEVYETLTNLSLKLATPEDGIHGDPGTVEPSVSKRVHSAAKDMAALQELSSKCKSDCDALLKVVRDVAAKDGGNRLWRSAKAAVKNALERRKISELESDIERTRSIMSLHIQAVLNQQIVELRNALRTLTEKNRVLGMQQTTKLDIITRGINDLKLNLGKRIDESEPHQQGPSVQQIEELVANLGRILSAEVETRKEQVILSSLCFPSRPVRHSAIPHAHRQTFGWIYQSHFAEWLKRENGVFWITGKAGSGKSTLMKFIADNPETKSIVAEWAKPKRAVIASHYFWSAGTDMQKSQQGLLQTLLFDILRQCPSVIPTVNPHRWETHLGSNNHPLWALSELSNTLCQIGNLEECLVQFCLFIDGLDEFASDHYDLCQTLKEFAKCPNIKLCISSRPLNVFEDFFGRNPSMKLSIHHKTKKDIRTFARSRLEDHPRWQEWSLEGSNKDELIDDIAERAEGVFLWAFLVTRSLRDGLTNDDTLTDLKKRLESLPTDLKLLFKHMLDGVDPIYHQNMAGTLRIALRATSPLRWEIYNYFDQEYDNSDYAIKLPVAAITNEELLKRRDQTRRRINARTRGLLEVNNHQPDDRIQRVEFLHRTVCDFLRTQDMSTYLSAKSNAGFEACCSICKAYVALIKSSRFFAGMEVGLGEDLQKLIREALSYASDIPSNRTGDAVEIIDELERSIVAMAKRTQALAHKSNSKPKQFFRTLILQENASNYLSRKLSQGSHYLSVLESPSLFVALQKSPPPMKTLSELLKHGQNPNEDFKGMPFSTPWCHLVREYCGWGHHTPPKQLDVALRTGLFSLFLQHGAGPNSNGFASHGGQFSSFAMFLLAFFGAWKVVDTDTYVQTLGDFISAGAEFDDTLSVRPLLRIVTESQLVQREGEFYSGIENSATIRTEFTRQLRRVLSRQLSEKETDDILSVVGIIGTACNPEKRHISEDLMGLVTGRIRKSTSDIRPASLVDMVEDPKNQKRPLEMDFGDESNKKRLKKLLP